MQNLPDSTTGANTKHGADVSYQTDVPANYAAVASIIAQYTCIRLKPAVLRDIISDINAATGAGIV